MRTSPACTLQKAWLQAVNETRASLDSAPYFSAGLLQLTNSQVRELQPGQPPELQLQLIGTM